MIAIKITDIPNYLTNGDFFRSLDLNDDETILIPKNVMWSLCNINKKVKLTNALESLRFWGINGMPYEIMDYILNNRDYDYVDSTFKDTFPVLRFLKKLSLLEDKKIWVLEAIKYGSPHVYQYLVDRKYFCLEDPVVLSLKYGRPSMVKYLVKKPFDVPFKGVRDAIYEGTDKHIECLEYLNSQGFLQPFIKKYNLRCYGSFNNEYLILPFISSHSNFEMLKFALSVGWNMPSDAMDVTAKSGNLKMLKYLKEKGIIIFYFIIFVHFQIQNE
jgi:hypothetical protein